MVGHVRVYPFWGSFNRDPHFQRVMRGLRWAVVDCSAGRFNRDPHFQRVMREGSPRAGRARMASIGTLIFRG